MQKYFSSAKSPLPSHHCIPVVNNLCAPKNGCHIFIRKYYSVFHKLFVYVPSFSFTMRREYLCIWGRGALLLLKIVV